MAKQAYNAVASKWCYEYLEGKISIGKLGAIISEEVATHLVDNKETPVGTKDRFEISDKILDDGTRGYHVFVKAIDFKEEECQST